MPPSSLYMDIVFPRTCRQWLLGGVVAMLVGCTSVPSAEPVVLPAGVETDLQRSARIRLELAASYLEMGQAEVAMGEVAQSLLSNPRNPDAYNLQGLIFLRQQDWASADVSFAKALALHPQDADARHNAGWSQCQQKQFAAADQSFEAALAVPRYMAKARTWLAKGVCLRQAGQPEAALKALSTAYEIEPGNPTIAYNFADLLYAQGDAQQARFYVRRLNNGQYASAASLWLGVKVERALKDELAMRQLAEQLEKRFRESREWQKFERGAFNE